MMRATTAAPEAAERFSCFGGTCAVLVTGRGAAGDAGQAAARAKRRLLEWHHQFSRFELTSELSALNLDPRPCVPVSPMMARFVAAALQGAELTGGLVDPTLLDEVERAGYASDRALLSAPAAGSLAVLPAPRPAAAHPAARWREIHLDRAGATVHRPPGVRLDSGGIAKGLFGDVLASVLLTHDSFAVLAAGDVRLGGRAGRARVVSVASPFDDAEVLHVFALAGGAVATSGRTKRSWLDAAGRLAHHIIDPSTGTPAFTGVVQATALAPTGVEAEARAKAALLAGPAAAPAWLPYGGVIVHDDGHYEVIDAHEPERAA